MKMHTNRQQNHIYALVIIARISIIISFIISIILAICTPQKGYFPASYIQYPISQVVTLTEEDV